MQDLKTRFLAEGLVQRLEVVNNSIVRVFVRSEPSNDMSSDLPASQPGGSGSNGHGADKFKCACRGSQGVLPVSGSAILH
jgi:hypothetical protein